MKMANLDLFPLSSAQEMKGRATALKSVTTGLQTALSEAKSCGLLDDKEMVTLQKTIQILNRLALDRGHMAKEKARREAEKEKRRVAIETGIGKLINAASTIEVKFVFAREHGDLMGFPRGDWTSTDRVSVRDRRYWLNDGLTQGIKCCGYLLERKTLPNGKPMPVDAIMSQFWESFQQKFPGEVEKFKNLIERLKLDECEQSGRTS